MVYFYFLILIPLITATRRFNGPSYRSNIMEGDKPILRMSSNADYAETNSDEGRQTIPLPKTKDPAIVRDMGVLVKWLIENFSYDVAPMEFRRINNNARDDGKPILRMPLSDTSDSDLDEDSDTEARKSDITDLQPLTENPVTPPEELPLGPPEDPAEEPPVDPSEEVSVAPAVEPSVETENSDGALRTKHETKIHKEEGANPEWVKDLKEYIKDLTTRYGLREVLEHAKPVIASLEKKHNMKIKDIDVDEYGEILITYIEKGKGKKTARKRKKSDDT